LEAGHDPKPGKPHGGGICLARDEKVIGVSEYQLTRSLPKSLKGSLPTIEEIEAELKEFEK
jgi:hypothetical protein